MLIEVLQHRGGGGGGGARSLFNQPQTGDMRSRPQCIYCIYVYIFIISFTLILAADWSIAVGYWTVFHCFSLLVNFRMGISVLSSLLKLRLNVLSSFAMVTMVDLKFTGHSLVVFYITRHTKRIKNKYFSKIKKKKNLE